MLNTVFRSENIDFAEVSEELIPDYLAMVNDLEHVEHFISRRTDTYTYEQEQEWVHRKREEKAVVFSMIERKTGDFIGNIELMAPSETEAELGIALTAVKQDMGYGTEGIRRILEYGFRDLGLKRISLHAYTFNTRAIHIYEKCGFRTCERTEEDVCMEVLGETIGGETI